MNNQTIIIDKCDICGTDTATDALNVCNDCDLYTCDDCECNCGTTHAYEPTFEHDDGEER